MHTTDLEGQQPKETDPVVFLPAPYDVIMEALERQRLQTQMTIICKGILGLVIMIFVLFVSFQIGALAKNKE